MTDCPSFAEWLAAAEDPGAAGNPQLESHLARCSVCAAEVAWIKTTLAALSAGPPPAIEGRPRRVLMQAFRDAHAESQPTPASEPFRCVADSIDDPHSVGVRRGRADHRYLRFVHDELSIELLWRPGADGEPGRVTGRLAAGSEPDGWRVSIRAGNEPPRETDTRDGGLFVLHDLPTGLDLHIQLSRPHHEGAIPEIEVPWRPLR